MREAPMRTAYARPAGRPNPLNLRADELVHPRDRISPRDRDVPGVHDAPFDAQQIARVAEDPSDVIRAVGEGVTRIAVRLFGVMDDVQATAAVRVDQPAEQQVRLSSDDVLLPIRSRDPPLMLG